MAAQTLDLLRYPGEFALFMELGALPQVQQGKSTLDAVRARDGARANLLASALKVGKSSVPRLAAALEKVAALLDHDDTLEAYVFPDAHVNAFVTRDGRKTLVGLSSTAVRHLSDEELEFVIGHELGHASFGHMKLPVEFLVQHGGLSPRENMRLRAWQRAAEISADRVGLVACGSLPVAGAAFFKTLSGLDHVVGEAAVEEFGGQWDELASEVVQGGTRDHWNESHPFPPLRMRAMSVFWKARAAGLPGGGDADREIGRMLAMMDPSAADAGESTDQLLSPFLFWGGLHVADSDGRINDVERERLSTVLPHGVSLDAALADRKQALDRFRTDLKSRRRKLSAVEIHRILSGVLEVAAADGSIDPAETGRLYDVGRELGVSGSACDLVLARFRADPKG